MQRMREWEAMEEMHVSEAVDLRIQRMPEHLVVIREGLKKSKKERKVLLLHRL